MNIPQNIIINKKSWTIKYKWNLINREGVKCNSVCDYRSQSIFIEKSSLKNERPLFFIERIVEIFHKQNIDGLPQFLLYNFRMRFIK